MKHELLLALLPLQIPVEEKAGDFAAGDYFIGLKAIGAGYGHGGSGIRQFSYWPERQPTVAYWTQPQNDTDNYSHMRSVSAGWELVCGYVQIYPNSQSTYRYTYRDAAGTTRSVSGDAAYGHNDISCEDVYRGAILQVQCKQSGHLPCRKIAGSLRCIDQD